MVLDEQTIPRTNITLNEVRGVMREQCKRDFNTPEKLLKSLNGEGTKAVFLATRCPKCESIFLHLCTGRDLYMYKNYEVWDIYWGDKNGIYRCTNCGAYDTLFLQHHTGKVIFDNSELPDMKFTIMNKETIEYCKTPLLKAR